MMNLYLLGGAIVVIIIGTVTVYLRGKSAGKKEEKYNNIQKEIIEGDDIRKENENRRNLSNDELDDRMRKYINY